MLHFNGGFAMLFPFYFSSNTTLECKISKCLKNLYQLDKNLNITSGKAIFQEHFSCNGSLHISPMGPFTRWENVSVGSIMYCLAYLGAIILFLAAYIGRANDDEVPYSPTLGYGKVAQSQQSELHSSGFSDCTAVTHGREAPEASTIGGDTRSDNEQQQTRADDSFRTSQPKAPLSRTKNVTQLEAAGELPSQFLSRFMSHCDDSPEACSELSSGEDYMVLEMPMDLTFALRHRCCRTTARWVQMFLAVLRDSDFCQKHVLANWRLLCGQGHQKRQGLTVPWFRRPSRLDRKFQTMRILASNPFISPYLAPEWMLQMMPPCYFVVST